jgi:hypothetical protein
MIETQHLQELKNICTDGNEYVQIFFYHLFLSVLPLEIQLSRVDGWDPLTGLTPLHFCACQRLVHGFPTSCLCSIS